MKIIVLNCMDLHGHNCNSDIEIFCYVKVRGYGVANPYRLRPYLGARVALDHVFTSVLEMYNPHKTPLQVYTYI